MNQAPHKRNFNIGGDENARLTEPLLVLSDDKSLKNDARGDEKVSFPAHSVISPGLELTPLQTEESGCCSVGGGKMIRMVKTREQNEDLCGVGSPTSGSSACKQESSGILTGQIETVSIDGWPFEYSSKLIVGNKDSNVGIATLWSVKEKVAAVVNKDDYCVIANYYDWYNGFEPLVRNCLSNTNIRYILVVGANLSRSKSVLLNFFENGITEKREGALEGTTMFRTQT
ncbi:TYSY [Biomphalaria pfeifferi]|uniref:TYSY n=1 Tax=Biomphalaria pfeifferi TaxID=112525 RepID=A0AAD8ANI1_BIOPF|nr:TYSY [Biomphalaria pfeifferi]